MAQEWACEPHTRAKHALLRRYVDAWVPIIASTAARFAPGEEITLIDGFAGPGGYTTGDDGSPLILLKAVLDRPEVTAAWSQLRFRFLFVEREQSFVEALRSRLDALGPLPSNVAVELRHGRFEEEIQSELDRRAARRSAPPTFAFIDPFGYSQSPMDLTRSLQLGPRVDTLTFVPFATVVRFVGREQQDAAMDKLFDSPAWREAIAMSGAERQQFLADLYRKQLTAPGQATYSLMFSVRTGDGNDYRLFFATEAVRGVEKMKDAMWSVDPQAGAEFVADPMEGQPVLFDVKREPDLSELARVVATRFTDSTATVLEVERFVTLSTAFRKQHVRRAMAPLEKSGCLEVRRPPGKARGWPEGTLLIFR